jgi:hypothetical protein
MDQTYEPVAHNLITVTVSPAGADPVGINLPFFPEGPHKLL